METAEKNLIEKNYENVLQVLSECTDDYIYIYDLKNDFYRISSEILEAYNLPADRFNNASEHIMEVVHPDDKALLIADMSDIREGKKTTHNLEYRWIDKNGKATWISCRGKVFDTGNKDDIILMGRIHRLDVKRKADDLTGFLTENQLKINYQKFMEENPNYNGAFIIIGLDNLKSINQKFGLAGGDIAIEFVGESIKDCVRGTTRIYRMEGDEFVIRVDGDINSAKDIYYSIRSSLEEKIIENNYEIFFTVSAGIFIASPDVRFEELKVKLEFSLNQAKKKGKNCVIPFKQEEYAEHIKLLDVQELLRESTNNNYEGYQVVYQPIIDSRTGKLSGAEALLRWRCEKYGNLSPAQFIPILEESGLIVPVGKWVAYTAIKQCKEWQKTIPNFKININLSYIQIRKSNVAVDIINLVQKIGIEPQYLTFEFTESGYLENDTSVRKLIKTFNTQGIKLALDDFGTGYSNLAYLQNFNVDIIKIDRSFVNKAMEDENIYNVISHIIDMAHNLNITVCIEGIENVEEQDKICKLLPDTMQGYLYGRPVPAQEFTEINISRYISN